MQDHPTNATPNVAATSDPADFELWDLETVCKFFGGIHRTTLYRGVTNRYYPKPVNTAPNVTRWFASECREALHKLRDARDKPKPKSRRGRPRKLPNHLTIV